MGRKRNQYLREFYIEKDNNCECKFCGHKISNYISNLKRHLELCHSEFAKELAKKPKINEPMNSKERTKFTVEMSKGELTNVCIDMIVKESMPLSFFDSNSFKVLTKPYCNGLKFPQINSADVLDLIANKAEEIKSDIKAKLETSLISLKIDITTYNERLFLGINVQIVVQDKIFLFSMALQELEKSHTAQKIKNKIADILRSYKINKNQIYSITYDNKCSHLLKAVEEPDQQIQNEMNKFEFENALSFECPAHILQLSVKDFLEESVLKAPAFQTMDCCLATEKPHSDIVTPWTSTYNMLKRLLELKNVSLKNLSVPETEWLKIESILAALEPVQEISKILKKSQLLLGDFYKYWMILTFNLKNIDTEESGKLLREIEKQQTVLLENDTMYAALYLDPRFRRTLNNTKRNLAVKHLKKIYLQYQSLEKEKENSLQSPSTKNEEIHKGQSSSSLVLRTTEPAGEGPIVKNEEIINDDFTMQSSSTEDIEPLDNSTIKIELNDYKMQSTSTSFLGHIQGVKNESDNNTMQSSSHHTSALKTENPINDDGKNKNSLSLLKNFLHELENSNESFDKNSDLDDCDKNEITRKVFFQIENYKEKCLDIDQDLLKYWNNKRFTYPWLRILALIAHSVPMTQMTNERTFAALQLMLGDLRYNLSEKHVDSIMFLKLNTDT